MTDRSKNILLFCASTTIGLCMIEGVLRFMEKEDFTLPIRLNENGFVTHKFNMDKMRYDGENKKKVHIKTNSEGFVGPDYEIAKPSNTLRVAIFGDSFTEAMQVDYEKTFPFLLEQKLNRSPLKGYEKAQVMNFGTGGTGTGDDMLFYHMYGRKYHPDIVVVAFYLGNDVDDNSKYLPLRDTMIKNQSEWNGVTPPDAASRTSFVGIKDVIFRSSAIVRFLDKVVRGSTWLSGVAQKVGLYRPPVVQKEIKNITKYDYYYFTEPDKDHKKAIVYSYELLNNFYKQVTDDGSKFVLMFIPQGIAVHPRAYEAYVATHPGLSTSTYSPQFLEDTLTNNIDNKVDIVHLAPQLNKLINEKGQEMYLVDGQGHFNETAHPIVSDILYEEIGKMMEKMWTTTSTQK